MKPEKPYSALERRIGVLGADLGSKMESKRNAKVIQNVIEIDLRNDPGRTPKRSQRITEFGLFFGIRLTVVFRILAKRAQDGDQMTQKAAKMVPEQQQFKLRHPISSHADFVEEIV